MASTKVSFPKYHLHKGSGQAFVQIKGKRYYLGVFDSPASRQAYSRFVAEMAASPISAPPVVQSHQGLLVLELCAAYWDFAQGYYVKNGRPTSMISITVLRRIDCVLEPTKQAVLTAYGKLKGKLENLAPQLRKASGFSFYNTSPYTFESLCGDAKHLGYTAIERSQMKFFRHRRPSLNILLGITKAKKRVKKELGITDALKPFRAWANLKRRVKRKVGYESEAGRLIRNGFSPTEN
jgi:hypothetical protein